MVVSRLIGGLGNQMFQYAAGRMLAVSNQCELKLDVSGYANYTLHNGFELALFKIQAGIITEYSKDIDSFANSRIVRFIRRKLNIKNKSHYVEKDFSFDPDFFYHTAPVYLDGYWQSYKYFESIEALLKNEFTPKTPLAGLNLEIAKKIGQLNSVSLHIRRGDYISNQAANKVHGFLGLAYYKKAIEIINSQLTDPYFFVFSDDILWAKDNLGLINNVLFVDHNTGKSSFEDMRLMSLCQHHIIANSSFSWWGAWLGNNPNKIVLCPGNWFATSEKDTSQLCPPTWLKL